ncbi:MAG TPA: DUF4238 domain-containing protein [Nocardioides sp.]|nr:DUF4238 domain-containing protein [Nocardioides sp.]
MTANVAKRHHTVPQFYLRGFSYDDQIGTVLLPGDRRFKQSIRKAASENGFYTVEGHSGGPDAIEKLMSKVEGAAAAVFDKIENGAWPLDQEDRDCLALFITLQAVRGPDQRRNLEAVAAQIARLEIGYGGRDNVATWVKSRYGVDISDEQADVVWAQATQPGGPPIRLAPEAHVEQMGALVDELFPYVAGRPWTLVRFARRSLLTCDVPVGLIAHPDDDKGSGVGFMTAWGITFALTRRIGLLMSDPTPVIAAGADVMLTRAGKVDHELPGTVRLQQLFNDRTILSAGQWVYHHPDDEDVVPAELPEPNLVTMRMSGAEDQFSGEPGFAPGSAGNADSPAASAENQAPHQRPDSVPRP